MVGGYVTYFVLVGLIFNPFLAIVLTAVVMFLFSAGVERALLNPLRRISGKLWMFNTFVLTLGVSQIMENGALVVWGPEFRGVEAFWPGTVDMLGVSFSYDRLILLVSSIVIMILLWAFLKFTRLGRAIRATGINEQAVPLFGVNVNMIYLFVFGLAGLVAAIGGAFYMALFTTYPLMGVAPNVKAWFVVLIAGLGNVKGAVICSILLSFVETLAIYGLSSGWQNVVGPVIVVLVLMFKPTGLFGTEVKGIWEK